jgi:hypothetical protein
MRRARPLLASILLAAACFVAPAAAQSDDVTDIARKDIPAAVRAQVDCGTEPLGVSRRPFAGGVVFAWRCASNHANQIEALVYAPKADGAGAQLLRFPQPGFKDPMEELSNVRWDAAARELSQLFVDPEQRVCRREATWRLDGTPPAPALIFWRETRDCEGRKGWKVVVDKRKG